MRARLLAAGALLALVGAPTAQARGCAHMLPRGPRVPAPVVFRTVCGVFELRRDGRVVYGRLPRSSPRWAPFATSHPDPRTWVAHPDRRLAVYRAGRLLWRSRDTGGSDSVAVGHGHVAFTSYRFRYEKLWIAPLGGRERLVARNEEIVAWTRGGLMTQRGRELLVRGPGGRRLRSLGTAQAAFRDGDGSVVVLRPDGRLVRTDGRLVRTIVDLRRLGMARQPWVQPVKDGLWAVQAGNRVLFLDRNGRRFAFVAHAPIAGNVLLLPDRSAVLYVVRRRASASDPGVMTVYRLGRDEGAPRALYRTRVRALSCGEWGGLAFRDGRVLFTSDEAGFAILDPAGRARPIELTRLARRLLPQRRYATTPAFVGWAA